MTQKQLEKLSRRRLLELLAEQTGKADRLERENQRLKERIGDREEHLAQMGTLAEAIVRSCNSGGLTAAEARQAEEKLNEICTVEIDEEDEEDEEEDAKPPGTIDFPTREQLLLAAQRVGGRQRYIWSLRTTVYAMLAVAAVAVLVAVLLLPVLQIYGTSMNPTLYEGDFVISIRGSEMDTGDLVAFYYNNKILVKRVIGQAGQWIDIEEVPTTSIRDLRVLKVWLGDGGDTTLRPDSITVDLLRDGEVYDTVELSSSTNWRYDWSKLETKYDWQVLEHVESGSGYAVSVSTDGVTQTITNTFTTDLTDEEPPLTDLDDPDVPLDPGPPDENLDDPDVPYYPGDPDVPYYPGDPDVPYYPGDPDIPMIPASPDDPQVDLPDEDPPLVELPQTGVLWWPVPIMAVLGAALILMGYARRRNAVR